MHSESDSLLTVACAQKDDAYMFKKNPHRNKSTRKNITDASSSFVENADVRWNKLIVEAAGFVSLSFHLA